MKLATPKNNSKVKGNTKKIMFNHQISFGKEYQDNKHLFSGNISCKPVQKSGTTFLSQEGFKYMNPKKKIMLTVSQKTSMMEISKIWLIESTSSRKIVFTDETRYDLDGPDNDNSWQNPSNKRCKPMRQ